MDLVASIGGAALTGLQMTGQAVVNVGGGVGNALQAGVASAGKAFAGEAAFFDEGVPVSRIFSPSYYLHNVPMLLFLIPPITSLARA